jgi:hypothetical protein
LYQIRLCLVLFSGWGQCIARLSTSHSVNPIHGSSGRDVVPMSVHSVRGCGIVEDANKPMCCIDKGRQTFSRKAETTSEMSSLCVLRPYTNIEIVIAKFDDNSAQASCQKLVRHTSQILRLKWAKEH